MWSLEGGRGPHSLGQVAVLAQGKSKKAPPRGGWGRPAVFSLKCFRGVVYAS